MSVRIGSGVERGAKVGYVCLREADLLKLVRGKRVGSGYLMGDDVQIARIVFEPSSALHFACQAASASVGEMRFEIPWGYEPVIVLESDTVEFPDNNDGAQP